MRIIIALLCAFALSPAYADATITFALTGAGAANTSRTLIVSDADGARILAWAKDAYGSGLTNKEAVEAAFDGMLAGLRANVKNLEGGKAAKTASDGITTITPK